MPDSSQPGDGPQPPREWPGRSVFDERRAAAARDDRDDRDAGDATDVLPAADRPPPPRGGRRVLDGAAFGLYEDEEPRRRWALVVGVLLAVAVVGVGLLVWRAVTTDAELVIPKTEDTTTTSAATVPVPTADAVLSLVPAGLGTCVPAGEPPEGGPPRAAVVCPRSGVPATVVFVLYASLEDREAEFAEVVEGFGVPHGGPVDGADCALGRNAVHDYIGFARVGQVACLSGGGIVDFVWTSDEAPLLVRARGGGSFADHYAFWDRIVERTDARFPLPAEKALLERLGDVAADECQRDLDLNVEAAGLAAVVCELHRGDQADAEPGLVSAVQFGTAETMAEWIDTTRSSLTGNVFDETDDACTPSGFGRRDTPRTSETTETTEASESAPTTTTATTTEAPAPDAGFTSYGFGARIGRVLCFVNSSNENVLFWVRDGALVGGIAVSDRSSRATMRDLLEWWTDGGHRL